MRRAVLFTAGVLTAGLAVATWPAGRASAGDVTTASWTQARASTPAGDSPDLQQSDGTALPVTNTGLGPAAISALLFPSGATTLELSRVDPASGLPTSSLPGLPVPSPVVWACPVTSSWKPGDRQPWAGRPAYDCTRHAAGALTAGGMYWDLGALADSQVDVVLVPATGETTPFDLSFAAPTAASFQARDVPPPPAFPTFDTTATTDAPMPATGPLLSPPGPSVPLTSPTAVPQQPVTLPAPQTVQPLAVRPVAATSAPRWVGPALLAFLALLLMAKAALPARADGAPRALVAVRPPKENP